MRADEWLVAQGMVSNRSRAKDLVRRQAVLLNGEPIRKAGHQILEGQTLELAEQDRYVGRGAHKLIAALDAFKLNVEGRIAVDLGASTGGFTQVLLERGVARVYAIDVGHGQLADSLQNHPQVVNMEGVNARNALELPEATNLVVGDLSFISLRLVWQTIFQQIGPEGDGVLLVKPQFEVGPGGVNQRGVVKHLRDAESAVSQLLAWGETQGLYAWGKVPSPLEGKKGNQEYLVHFRQQVRP